MNQFQLAAVLLHAIVLAALVSVVYSVLPSKIKVCSRNEPQMEQCIINAVEHLRPALASGDFGPDFNVPKLEPQYFKRIKVQRGRDLEAVFTDVYVNGGSNFKIEKIEFQGSPMNLSFDYSLTIPRSNFSGKYALKMKILLLDLQGQGDITGELINTHISNKLRGYTERIDGKDYVRFHRFNVRIKIDDGKFHMSNLFNGDPVLGEVGNQVVNENSKLFLEEFIPGLERSFSKIYTDIVNKLMRDATIDELFPESV